MTDNEWAAEGYRRQRKSHAWWPVIVVGLLVLGVTSFQLARLVLNRIVRGVS